MKKLSLLMLLWLLGIVSLKAQSISKAEYFFDKDPGVGNANALSVTASGAITASYGVSTSGLTAGMHQLFVRFGFSTGEWGPVEGKMFYIDQRPLDTTVNINALEYFYDKEPGLSKGTEISIPASRIYSNNVSLATNSIANGWHRAYIRAKYSNGEYGFYTSSPFLMVAPDKPLLDGKIVKLEYFVDYITFYGNGNNFNIPFSPARVDSITISDSLVLNKSIVDSHTITVHAKNAWGTWSKDTTKKFFVKRTVGIENAMAPEDIILIYPNPVKDLLYIDGKFNHIVLTDLNGKTILTNDFIAVQQHETINMEMLPAGVYILKTYSINSVSSKKIIKN